MGWCTVQWKMLLFCVKIIVKESHKIELAILSEEEEGGGGGGGGGERGGGERGGGDDGDDDFGHLATFWFNLVLS